MKIYQTPSQILLNQLVSLIIIFPNYSYLTCIYLYTFSHVNFYFFTDSKWLRLEIIILIVKLSCMKVSTKMKRNESESWMKIKITQLSRVFYTLFVLVLNSWRPRMTAPPTPRPQIPPKSTSLTNKKKKICVATFWFTFTSKVLIVISRKLG